MVRYFENAPTAAPKNPDSPKMPTFAAKPKPHTPMRPAQSYRPNGQETAAILARLDTLTADVRAIKSLLTGDEYRQPGLLDQLSSITARLQRLERLVHRVKWAAIGLAIGVGSLGVGLSELLNHLFGG